jgi:glycosyltransferase involved in cell wall biosynthesis
MSRRADNSGGSRSPQREAKNLSASTSVGSVVVLGSAKAHNVIAWPNISRFFRIGVVTVLRRFGLLGWRDLLKGLKTREAIEAFCRGHRNATALDAGFSLATYLSRYPDVADSVDNPIFAVFHYLQFGLQEGRNALPTEVEPKLVRDLYCVELNEGVTAAGALKAVREAHGLTYFDVIYLTEIEVAACHGFRKFRFLDIFDHEYYRARALGDEHANDQRARCLLHFVREGRHVPFDINHDWAFDHQFYATEYEVAASSASRLHSGGDLARCIETVSKPRLFNDWVTHGLSEGRLANIDVWTSHNYGFTIPPSMKSQMNIYRCFEHDLNSALPTEICRHMIEKAGFGLNKLTLSDRAAADFIVAIADRLSANGDKRASERLYFLVLERFPDHGRALRHRADHVERDNLLGLAVELRRKIIEEKLDNVWSYITLADCYQKLGDELSAALTMNQGSEAYPNDLGMRIRARTMAKKAFDSLWSSSVQLALGAGTAAVQSALRRMLDVCTPAFDSPTFARKIRSVAIVGVEDLPQCKFYRIDQKVEHLTASDYVVETFDCHRDIDDYLKRLSRFDATIFYRVPAFPAIIDAIAKTAEFGIATFYEVDDLIFDAAYFPPSFASYADQITQEQYAALACGVPLYEHAMRLCQYGIASTPSLQSQMSERVRSGKVFLHRNALGNAHEEAMRVTTLRKESSVCTIFYGSGTKAHKEDFRTLIEPALIEIILKHHDCVRVIVIGYLKISEALREVAENIIVLEPIWNIEEYYSLLSQADINIAVLEPSLIADCKSEIKWLEAAVFGIPSVLSDNATHREVIEHGRTGFLCRTAAEFATSIDLLVREPELRKAIGDAARTEARTKYSVASQAKNIRAIFQSVSNFNPPRKRVLIVNVFYPPQAIGGATRVVYDNVTELRKQFDDRFEITVLCSLEGGQIPYNVDHYCYEGVRVFTITAPSEADIDRKASDVKMGEAFSECLDMIEPDVIHFHCIQRLTASVVEVVRRRKIPYFITAHDGWWISPNQFLVGADDEIELYDFRMENVFGSSKNRRSRDLTRMTMLRRPLTGAAKIFAVSKEFAEIYEGTGLTNVMTIENGVSRLPECVRTASSDGRVRLAHIGGATRHKGYHLVRNALLTNSFENLRLLVIDLALPKGAIRDEVWGSTPVTISAKFDQLRIDDLYSQIDVLLAPSIWPESYGLVTREALASGCWVVASDRGAIGACVVDGVNGFRIDVSSHLGLTNALREIDRSPLRFCSPPAKMTVLRTAAEQATELANWYGGAAFGGAPNG